MFPTTRHTQINQLIFLFEQEEQLFRKVHRMVDLFETVIKTHTAVIVADYFRQGQLSQDIKGMLAAGLRTPSLGIWQMISRMVINEMSGRKDTTTFIDGFYAYFQKWDKRLDSRNDGVFAFRNQYAHGATPSDKQCGEDIRKMTPLLQEMLAVDWLSASTVVVLDKFDGQWKPVPQDGWNDDLLPAGLPFEFPGMLVAGRPYLAIEADGAIRLLDLFPILFYKQGIKEEANYRSLAFLNDLKKWDKKEISFLNYPHSHLFREGAGIFEQFGQIIKVDEWKRWLSRDFKERIQQLTENFQGRDIELATLQAFIKNKHQRFAIVQGDAGIGKSALLARLQEEIQLNSGQRDAPVVIEYFIRRGSQFAFSSKLVTYFIERLSQVFSIPLKIETSVDDNFILLRELVSTIAHKLGGRQLIFLIDGVDEGISDDPKLTDYLWMEVPGSIKVVYSGRRGQADLFFDRVRIACENDVCQINLVALQESVVRAILYNTDKYKLLSEEGRHYIHQVALRSGGNPNYLKWLLNSIENGDIELNAADTLPENVEAFFEPFLQKFSSAIGSESALVLKCLYTIAAAKDMLSPRHVQLIQGMDHGEVERVFGRLSEVLMKSERVIEHNSGSMEVVKFYQIYHEDFLMYLKRYRADQVRGEEEAIIRFSQQVAGTTDYQTVNRYIQRYTFEFLPLHLYQLYQVTGASQFKDQLLALCYNDTFKEKQVVFTDQYERTFQLLYYGFGVLDEHMEARERISIGIEALKLRKQFYSQIRQIKKWVAVGGREEVLLVLRRISLFETEAHRLILYYYLLSRLTFGQGEKARPLLELVLKTMDDDLPPGNTVLDWTNWLPPEPVMQLLHQLHFMDVNIIPFLSRGDAYALGEMREMKDDSIPPRVWAWEQTKHTLTALLDKPTPVLMDFLASQWRDNVKGELCCRIAKVDPDKAMLVTELIKDPEFKIKALFAQAETWFEKKLLDKGNSLLDQAELLIRQVEKPKMLDLDDWENFDKETAYEWLTRICIAYQQFGRALTAIENISEFYWARMHFDLAVALEQNRETAQASGIYQKLIGKLSQQNNETFDNEVLAKTYIRIGSLEDAKSLVEKAKDWFEKNLLEMVVVETLLEQGRIMEAIDTGISADAYNRSKILYTIISYVAKHGDIETIKRLLPMVGDAEDWMIREVAGELYGKIEIEQLLQWLNRCNKPNLGGNLVHLLKVVMEKGTAEIPVEPFHLLLVLVAKHSVSGKWLHVLLELADNFHRNGHQEFASRLINKIKLSQNDNKDSRIELSELAQACQKIGAKQQALIYAQAALGTSWQRDSFVDKLGSLKQVAVVYIDSGKADDILNIISGHGDEWFKCHALLDLAAIIAASNTPHRFEEILNQVGELAQHIDREDSHANVIRMIARSWYQLANKETMEDRLLDLITVPVDRELNKEELISDLAIYYKAASQQEKSDRLLTILEKDTRESTLVKIGEYNIEQDKIEETILLTKSIDDPTQKDELTKKIIDHCIEQEAYQYIDVLLPISRELVAAYKKGHIRFFKSDQPMLQLLLCAQMDDSALEMAELHKGGWFYDQALVLIAEYYLNIGNITAARLFIEKIEKKETCFWPLIEAHYYYVQQADMVSAREMLERALAAAGHTGWIDENLATYLTVLRSAVKHGFHDITEVCHSNAISDAHSTDRRDAIESELHHKESSYLHSVVEVYLKAEMPEVALTVTSEIGFEHHRAYSVCVIAEYFLSHRQVEKCHQMIELALEIIETMPTHFYYQQQRLYIRVAGIYCNLGEIKKAHRLANRLPEVGYSEAIHRLVVKYFLEKNKIHWAVRITDEMQDAKIKALTSNDIAEFLFERREVDTAMILTKRLWDFYKTKDYFGYFSNQYDIREVVDKFREQEHLKAFYRTIDFDKEEITRNPAWFALMHVNPVKRLECIALVYRNYSQDAFINEFFKDYAIEDFGAFFMMVYNNMPASSGKVALIAEGLERLREQPDKLTAAIPAAMPAFLMNQKLLETALLLYAADLFAGDRDAMLPDHQHLQQLSRLIGGAAVFAPVARPYSFLKMEEWITTVNDKDNQSQIALWAKSVRKGKMTVQEFESNTEKLLEN